MNKSLKAKNLPLFSIIDLDQLRRENHLEGTEVTDFFTARDGKVYDPYGYAKPDINTQPLFYSLRDNEIYLDIGNEGKINNTFEIVCQWMDKLLIPKMNELCATE